MEQSIEHVRRHFQETMTVEQLAVEVNVGRWQYTRMFKEIDRKIPLNFLNELRIDRAKQLLMKTDDRLYDIARNVGFSNEYYFSRRFRQTAGVTPRQYRRCRR